MRGKGSVICNHNPRNIPGKSQRILIKTSRFFGSSFNQNHHNLCEKLLEMLPLSPAHSVFRIAIPVLLAIANTLYGATLSVPVLAGSNSSTVINLDGQRDFLYYYNRALTSIEAGRWTEAIADLSRSLELNPDFVPGLVNRGNVYLEIGDFERARSDFERALALEPNDPFARNNLGLVYLNSERGEEAIQQFSRALALDGEYAEAYFNRGLALVNTGKTREGLDDLERAIELFQRQGDAEAVEKIREVQQSVRHSP
jgi:tetratricopeptide (TPR) repeat protein